MINQLALTFGTLLSSQGADAHPPGLSTVLGATLKTLPGSVRGVKPPDPVLLGPGDRPKGVLRRSGSPRCGPSGIVIPIRPALACRSRRRLQQYGRPRGPQTCRSWRGTADRPRSAADLGSARPVRATDARPGEVRHNPRQTSGHAARSVGVSPRTLMPATDACPDAAPGSGRTAGPRGRGSCSGSLIRRLLRLAPPSATVRRASDREPHRPGGLQQVGDIGAAAPPIR